MASSVFIGSPQSSSSGGSVTINGVLSISSTAVTSTVPYLAPDGTAALPAIAFASAPTSGFSFSPTTLSLSLGAAARHQWDSTSYYNLSNSAGIYFGAAADASLLRGAAGRIDTTKAFRMTPVAFASLPTAAEGAIAWVNNSTTETWGATIAGGGAFKVLATYNGTNWTVAGK